MKWLEARVNGPAGATPSQLKIEREAVKEDSDAASKELASLNEQIDTTAQYADLEEIWLAEKAAVQGVTQIKSIEQAKLELEVARRAGGLARMSEIQHGLLPDLERRLLAASDDELPEPTLLRSRVSEEVADVVSRWTGIPVAKMLESDREKLLRMEESLHERVIGQDEAVKAVSHAVRRARAGWPIRRDRMALFCFWVQPAWARLSSARHWLIICSIASRPWSALICGIYGAALCCAAHWSPSRVCGYEQGGYLTEAVRRRPYSLLLLVRLKRHTWTS